MRRLVPLLIILPLLLLAVWRLKRPAERAEALQQWPVMGTFLSVRAYAGDTAAALAAVRSAGRAVFRVDSLMSTWKQESEISRLNAAAGSGEWTSLSAETLEVLLAARSLASASAGAFDITVGPLMHVWGFRDGGPRLPSPAALDSSRALVGNALLELDSAGARARLRRRGSAVDLGAIAKGYALDRAAASMRAAGAVAGMADLGGQVVVFGPPPEGRGHWVVGILDPRDPSGTIGEIRLKEGSVASSGDYEQFFEVGGVRYSHIMDPRRGRPARGTLQTTVVAPTGLQSDGLSTTLFVLGADRGRAFLAQPFARGTAAVWVRDSLPLDAHDVVVAGAATDRIRLEIPGPR
jgi:thiamine biosynthesis lipoprotein